MKKLLHRANTRGKGEYGWLSTRYSFSFADWYDPSRMGFGALRVLNDDTIAPASGFPMHGHKDMEIITVVTQGSLTHHDNLGNVGHISEGEVQVMSAGTGIVHSEYNASPANPLNLFQIWIQTGRPGAAPRYGETQRSEQEGGLIHLVGPEGGNAPATILQDASISKAIFVPDTSISYQLSGENRGVYVFVIDGTLVMDKEKLGPRDGMGATEATSIELHSVGKAAALIIEVPML